MSALHVTVMGGGYTKTAGSDKQNGDAGESSVNEKTDKGQNRELSVEGQYEEEIYNGSEDEYMSEEDGYKARCHSYFQDETIESTSSDNDEFGATYDRRDNAVHILHSHPVGLSDASEIATMTPVDEDCDGESFDEENDCLADTVMKSLEQINASQMLYNDAANEEFSDIENTIARCEDLLTLEPRIEASYSMMLGFDASAKRTNNENFLAQKSDLNNVQPSQGTVEACMNETANRIPPCVSSSEECKHWREIPDRYHTTTANCGTDRNIIDKNIAAGTLWEKSDNPNTDKNADKAAISKNTDGVVANENISVETISRNTKEVAIDKNTDVIMINKNNSEETFSKNLNENIIGKNTNKGSIGKNIDVTVIDTNTGKETSCENDDESIIGRGADRGAINKDIDVIISDINTSKGTLSKDCNENITDKSTNGGAIDKDIGVIISDKNTSVETFSKSCDKDIIEKNTNERNIGKNANERIIFKTSFDDVSRNKMAYSEYSDGIVIDRSISEETLCKKNNSGAVGKNTSEVIIGKSLSNNINDKNIDKGTIGKDTDGNIAEKNIVEETISKNADVDVVDKNTIEATMKKNTDFNISGKKADKATIGSNTDDIVIDTDARANAISKNTNNIIDCIAVEETVSKKTHKGAIDTNIGAILMDKNTNEEAFSKDADENRVGKKNNDSTIDKNASEYIIGKNISDNIFEQNIDEDSIGKNTIDIAIDKNISEESVSNNSDRNISHKNTEKDDVNKNINNGTIGKNINGIVVDKTTNEVTFGKIIDGFFYDHTTSEKAICENAVESEVSKNTTEIVSDSNISEITIRQVAFKNIVDKNIDVIITGRNTSEEAFSSKNSNDIIVDSNTNEDTVNQTDSEDAVDKNTGENIIEKNINERAIGKSTNNITIIFNTSEENISKNSDENISFKNADEANISNSTGNNISDRIFNEDTASKNTDDNLIAGKMNDLIGKNTDESIADMRISEPAGDLSMDENIIGTITVKGFTRNENCEFTKQCIDVTDMLPLMCNEVCKFPENEEVFVGSEVDRSGFQNKTPSQDGNNDRRQDANHSVGDSSQCGSMSNNVCRSETLNSENREIKNILSADAVKSDEDFIVEGNTVSSLEVGNRIMKKEYSKDSTAVIDVSMDLKESGENGHLHSFSNSRNGSAPMDMNKEVEQYGNDVQSTIGCKKHPPIDENSLNESDLSKPKDNNSGLITESETTHVTSASSCLQSEAAPITSAVDVSEDNLPVSSSRLTIKLIESSRGTNSGDGNDQTLSGEALVEHTKKAMDQILKSGLADALLPTKKSYLLSYQAAEKSDSDNSSVEKEPDDSAKTAPTSSALQSSKSSVLSLSGSSITRDPVFKFISTLLEKKNAKVVSSSLDSTVIVISPNDEEKEETRKEGEKHEQKKPEENKNGPLPNEGGLSIVLDRREDPSSANVKVIKSLSKSNEVLPTPAPAKILITGCTPVGNITDLGANCNPGSKTKDLTKSCNASKKRKRQGVVSNHRIPHKKIRKDVNVEDAANHQLETNIVCLPDKNLVVNFVAHTNSNSKVPILADNKGLSVSKNVAKRTVYRDISKWSRRLDHGKVEVDEAKIDWLEKQFLQANQAKLKQYYDALKESLLTKKTSPDIPLVEKETAENMLQNLKTLSVKNLALIRANEAMGKECSDKYIENVLNSLAHDSHDNIPSSKASRRSNAQLDGTANGLINTRKNTSKQRKLNAPSTSTSTGSRNSDAKYKTVSRHLGSSDVVTTPVHVTAISQHGHGEVIKPSTEIHGNNTIPADEPEIGKEQLIMHASGAFTEQSMPNFLNGINANAQTDAKIICSQSGTVIEHQTTYGKQNTDNCDRMAILQGYQSENEIGLKVVEHGDYESVKNGNEAVDEADNGEKLDGVKGDGAGNKGRDSNSQTSGMVGVEDRETSFQILESVSYTPAEDDSIYQTNEIQTNLLLDAVTEDQKLVSQAKYHDAVDKACSYKDEKEGTTMQMQVRHEGDAMKRDVFEKELALKQNPKDITSEAQSSSDTLAQKIAKRLFVAEKKPMLKSMFSKAKKEINSRVTKSGVEAHLHGIDSRIDLKSPTVRSDLMPEINEASRKEVNVFENERSAVSFERKSSARMSKASNPVELIGKRQENVNAPIPQNLAFVSSEMPRKTILDSMMASQTNQCSLAYGIPNTIEYSVKGSKGNDPPVILVRNSPVSESSIRLFYKSTSSGDQKVAKYQFGDLKKAVNRRSTKGQAKLSSGATLQSRNPQHAERSLQNPNAANFKALVEHLRKPDVKLALEGVMKVSQEKAVQSDLLGPQLNLTYSKEAASVPIVSNKETKHNLSLDARSSGKPMQIESRGITVQNLTSKDSDILGIQDVENLLKTLKSPDATNLVLGENIAVDVTPNGNKGNFYVVKSDLNQKKLAMATQTSNLDCTKESYGNNMNANQRSNVLENVSKSRKRKMLNTNIDQGTGNYAVERIISDNTTFRNIDVEKGSYTHKDEDRNVPSKDDESTLYLEMAIRSIASKSLHLGSSPKLVSRPGVTSNYLSRKRTALRESTAQTSVGNSKLLAGEAGVSGLHINKQLTSLSWRNIRYNRTLIGRKRTLLDSTATLFSWECVHLFNGRNLRHDRPSIINKLQKYDIKMQRIREHYGYLRKRTCLREESKESGKGLDEGSSVEKEASPKSLRATASKCPVFVSPKEVSAEKESRTCELSNEKAKKESRTRELLNEKARRLPGPACEKPQSKLKCKEDAINSEKRLPDLSKVSKDRRSIVSSPMRQHTKSCQTSAPSKRPIAQPLKNLKGCACSNVVRNIKGTAFENSIGNLARSIVKQVRKRKNSGENENICSKCNKVLESAKELTRHVLYHLVDKAVDCSFDSDGEQRRIERRKVIDFHPDRREESEKDKALSCDMVYFDTNENLEIQENSQTKESQIYKAQFWTKPRVPYAPAGEDELHSLEASDELPNDSRTVWTPLHFDVPVKPVKWQCLKCREKYNSIRELKLHADDCARIVPKQEIEEPT